MALMRLPLRKKRVVLPPPSAQDLLYAKEIQLQEEEAARRVVLEKQVVSEREVDSILEAEFGERRRQLICELNAVLR
ncbi:hypothetical protein J1614_010812 [Plenodomus biglobosus]|nr:hypothetical protein J1614_010812 [Plenodomus biglobosus]